MVSALTHSAMTFRLLPEEEKEIVWQRVNKCAEELHEAQETIILKNCKTPYESVSALAIMLAEQIAGHAKTREELEALLDIFHQHVDQFANQVYDAVESGEVETIARGHVEIH